MSGVLGSIPGYNNKGECMKRATWLVVFCGALSACDVAPLSATDALGPDAGTPVVSMTGSDAQAIVTTSGVPPLGEAVPPISGFPGDGAAVAVAATSWSTPGAVRWHGGQWLMPYSLSPGSVLQNVSCDIWNPTTAAPANVLVEVVSSNGQVLGASTAPASSSVVIRSWPFLGTHAVVNGEQVIVRLSPTDATTHAWTTGAQDTTVISCAARSTTPRTLIVPVQMMINTRTASLGEGMGNVIAGNVGDPVGGYVQYIPLSLPVGTMIDGWRVRVQDSAHGGASSQISSRLMSTTDNNNMPVSIAQSTNSTGNGMEQTITASSVNVIAAPQTQYWISVFDAVGASDGFVRRLELDIE